MGSLLSRRAVLQEEVTKPPLAPVVAPRIAGFGLRLVARIARSNSSIGIALCNKLRKDNGFHIVTDLAAATNDAPAYAPLHVPTPSEISAHKDLASKASVTPRSGQIGALHKAYTEKRITPTEVAEAVLKACEEAKHLNCIREQLEKEIRSAAAEATERYAAGKPKGILDGVPVLIKEEVAVRGHRATQGTSFMTEVSTDDCEPVKRLRAGGALLCGTTNMHEIGIGTTGHNVHYGATRNPYNKDCYPGGSSAGSGAAVGAGLVPLALGADGGGSVRIPAALCGAVGLKPSFMRIPCENSLDWSVGVVGPLAPTVNDLALSYLELAGGADHISPLSSLQPTPHLHGFGDTADLSDLRIGKFTAYFDQCDSEVRNAAEKVLESLKSRGATVVEVKIDHLEAISKAHAITILTEMASAMEPHWDDHAGHFAPDTAINLSIARTFTARDMLAAQKVRGCAMRQLKEIYRQVDVMVFPGTACVAPELKPDAVRHGESDLETTAKIMRYSFLANFCGLPAGVVPMGLHEGLPLSFQAMADTWNEHIVLRVLKAVEEVEGPLPKPPNHWDTFSKL